MAQSLHKRMTRLTIGFDSALSVQVTRIDQWKLTCVLRQLLTPASPLVLDRSFDSPVRP